MEEDSCLFQNVNNRVQLKYCYFISNSSVFLTFVFVYHGRMCSKVFNLKKKTTIGRILHYIFEEHTFFNDSVLLIFRNLIMFIDRHVIHVRFIFKGNWPFVS